MDGVGPLVPDYVKPINSSLPSVEALSREIGQGAKVLSRVTSLLGRDYVHEYVHAPV